MRYAHFGRVVSFALTAPLIVALSPQHAAGQQQSYWGGRWNFSDEQVYTDPLTNEVVVIPAHAYAFYRPSPHRREDFSLNIYCSSGQPELRFMGIDGTQLPIDIRPGDTLETRWRFDDAAAFPRRHWLYTVDPGAPTERRTRVRRLQEGATQSLEHDSPVLVGLRDSHRLRMQVHNQRNGLMFTLSVDDGLKGSSLAMGRLHCLG
ncbi:MAG: hypothetical protein ACYS7M_13115 [Planctomycetota bacterium]|jgi:hypothetical protein